MTKGYNHTTMRSAALSWRLIPHDSTLAPRKERMHAEPPDLLSFFFLPSYVSFFL